MKRIKSLSLRDQLRRGPNQWCRMEIQDLVGAKSTQLLGILGEKYDLQDAYETGQAKRRLDLTPHGFFLQLAPGNRGHAKEFLGKFGPLKLTAGDRILGSGTHTIVNLDEFWSMHLRFRLVTELWNSLHRRDALSEAFVRINQNRERASNHQEFLLATEPSPPPATTVRAYKFPWEHSRQSVEEWLQTVKLADLRRAALYLVNIELNIHARDFRFIWGRGWEASASKFRPVIWLDSLWAAMWQFWGMDTNAGLTARRCPHCQKLFYPKRRDQFYCTPRQQGLASKRQYASRMRAGKRK
jgi:hypothetical protein